MVIPAGGEEAIQSVRSFLIRRFGVEPEIFDRTRGRQQERDGDLGLAGHGSHGWDFSGRPSSRLPSSPNEKLNEEDN